MVVDGVPDWHGLQAEVASLQSPKAITTGNREEANVSWSGMIYAHQPRSLCRQYTSTHVHMCIFWIRAGIMKCYTLPSC